MIVPDASDFTRHAWPGVACRPEGLDGAFGVARGRDDRRRRNFEFSGGRVLEHIRDRFRSPEDDPGRIDRENPIVCANINKIGFRMSGGLAEYERAIRERKFRPIAMSVFASGAIAPEEALRYVCDQKQIVSIVFGASSRGNIAQTKEIIERLSSTH